MENSTRRTFLALTGAGAAAAGVAAVAVPRAAGDGPADTVGPDEAAGSMVAWVRDAATGEVTVMVEGREVVVTDRALVAAMHRAVAGASRRT